MAGKRLFVVLLLALSATAMAFVVGGQGAVAQTGPEGLDSSHWGNAQTIVPVYDTVWDLGVSARVEQVEEYTAWLADEGFSGFATTYLGAIHRPANRSDQNFFTRGDPYGNPIATWDAATGNLIMNAAHANRFEQFLDAAHAEGLRVQLFVIWERKAVDEYGLINDGNAYNWAHQIGSRFKGHPAIQSWILGGDAETDNPRTTLWNNAAAGLRDAGVTGEITYGTGSAPQRRINNLNASWNEGQFVQTSHCGTPDLIEQRISRVVGQSNIPVWAGEMRYEAINADWCNPAVPIPGANEVRADALAAVRAGAAGIVYGHNDRWQWGHGALGGNNSGWNAVRASFNSPGHRAVISALGGTPPAPTTTIPTTTTEPPPPDVTDPLVETTSPAANASLSPNSAATISGTVTDESALERIRVRVRRSSSAGVQFWNGSAWQGSIAWNEVLASSTGSWSLTGVDLSGIGSYAVHHIGRDSAGNTSTAVENPSVSFVVGATAPSTTPSTQPPAPTTTQAPTTTMAPTTIAPTTTVPPAPGRTDPLVQVTSPSAGAQLSPNSNATIAGVASDDSGQVTLVRVRVRRTTAAGNEFWNGSGWQSSVYWQTVSRSAGVFSLTGVDLSTAASYTVHTIGRDGAGNIATARENPSINFSVVATTPTTTTAVPPTTQAPTTTAPPVADTVGPVVSVTAPTASQTLSPTASPLTIQGTATDASTVNTVRVRIRRAVRGALTYWNGSAWVSSSVWLDLSPAANGSWQVPGVDAATVGSYRVQLVGIDEHGNVSNATQNGDRVFVVR